MSATLRDAQAAKAHALQVFGKLGGEVAVGIMKLGEDDFGLKVNLTEAPDSGVTFPDQIDGVPVKVEVVGRLYRR